MNIGAPWPDLDEAEQRVLGMQTKLHRWAGDPRRRFDDLYNLVADPAFLVVAWNRVRVNKGARSAGVDGIAPRSIGSGAGEFLSGLRDDLKACRFTPVRVRETMIPKANGKLRRLGIPTAADRVVQASLKLVLEPIFEADFKPCSYGFRPRRRAQDAIAEIHYLASPSRTYEWVFEADIAACFDEIDHQALMGRVRARIGDKRVLGLVGAFLGAGVLSGDGANRETITGTPQGGILSPLLANIALSVLDEHFARKWEALGPAWTRAKRRRSGTPAFRLVRYADDFVVMVGGTRDDADALWAEVSAVLAPMGLRLSGEKTRVCHIDEGFDFLGFRIQRRSWRGRAAKRAVYTYPSKKALASVMGKVRSFTRERSIERSPTCSTGSTRCCGDGATTSVTACRRGVIESGFPIPTGGRHWVRPERGYDLARSSRSRCPPHRALRASARQGRRRGSRAYAHLMSEGRPASAGEYPAVPAPAKRLTSWALGIDVGGTSIKAAVVDVASGQLVTERIREPTPSPATPEAILDVVVDVVRRLEATGLLTAGMPGGAGFPSVIRAGHAMTATQLDPSWIGAPVQAMLEQRLGRPMLVLNDADAAGVGELAHGAGQGQSGVVLLLTLGTGIGSALFIGGQLVPNLQLGHVKFHGRDAESRLSRAARTRRNIGWKRWGSEFNELLTLYETYLWPDLIILGGGMAQKFSKYRKFLKTSAPLVAAAMGNTAGIVGAARLGANAARASGATHAR